MVKFTLSKYLLCLSWFFLAIFAYTATSSLLYITQRKQEIAVVPYKLPVTASSSQPSLGTVAGVSISIEGIDGRQDIVAAFLARYTSPLQPYDHFAKFIVDTADKYGVDYRLIPAIMMQESNLCKAIPQGSYNCLGFGIHARGTLGFASYEESIDRATRELKKNYIDIGLDTPEKIMTKYTPGSNGSWAASVNQWIAEMEYNSRDLGKAEKNDANLNQYTQK
ncbi:MAG: hypothetical protein AAB612_01275 [Patescibacteria group bacterium]